MKLLKNKIAELKIKYAGLNPAQKRFFIAMLIFIAINILLLIAGLILLSLSLNKLF